MRFNGNRAAAKASLVEAPSIPQPKIEPGSGANGSRPAALAGRQKLRFGPFELSIGERVLLRDGRALPLGDRALDILSYLANRPGEVIAKQELMDHVWPGVTVEDGSVRVHVAAIRKALGDGQFGHRYIVNIKGRGYSFVGTVVTPAGSTESGSNGAALSMLDCLAVLFSDFDPAREMVDRAIAPDLNSYCLAIALGHLRRETEAREVAAALLKLEPGFRISEWPVGQWLPQIYIDGLRKAGLPE